MKKILGLMGILAMSGCMSDQERQDHRNKRSIEQRRLSQERIQFEAHRTLYEPKVTLPFGKEVAGSLVDYGSSGYRTCTRDPLDEEDTHVRGVITKIGFVPTPNGDTTINQLAHGGGAVFAGGDATNVARQQNDVFIQAKSNHKAHNTWSLHIKQYSDAPPPGMLLTRFSAGDAIRWPVMWSFGSCRYGWSKAHPTFRQPNNKYKARRYEEVVDGHSYQPIGAPMITLSSQHVDEVNAEM